MVNYKLSFYSYIVSLYWQLVKMSSKLELTVDDYYAIDKTKEQMSKEYKTVEDFEKDDTAWIIISNLAYNLFANKLSNTKLFTLNVLCEVIKKEHQNSLNYLDSLLKCLYNKRYKLRRNDFRPISVTDFNLYFDNTVKRLFTKIQDFFDDYSSTISFYPDVIHAEMVENDDGSKTPAIHIHFAKPILIRLGPSCTPFYKEELYDIKDRLMICDTAFSINKKTKTFNPPKHERSVFYNTLFTIDGVDDGDDNEIRLGVLDSFYIINHGEFKTAKAYLVNSVVFKDSDLIEAIKQFD